MTIKEYKGRNIRSAISAAMNGPDLCAVIGAPIVDTTRTARTHGREGYVSERVMTAKQMVMERLTQEIKELEAIKWMIAERSNCFFRGTRADIADLPVQRTIESNEMGGEDLVVYSVWRPTAEERQAIAQGANIRLAILGAPMPPVAIDLTEEKILSVG